MRYILDNIVLTQEIINWAKVSKQPQSSFIKAWLCKSLWSCVWPFLFRAMEAIGFALEFVNMTKLLFNGATASVYMNGTPSKPFPMTVTRCPSGLPGSSILFSIGGGGTQRSVPASGPSWYHKRNQAPHCTYLSVDKSVRGRYYNLFEGWGMLHQQFNCDPRAFLLCVGTVNQLDEIGRLHFGNTKVFPGPGSKVWIHVYW